MEKKRGDRKPPNPERDFLRMLRKLKKEFQKDVLPSVKRKQYHLSKSERDREKARKAARRLRRQMQKIQRYG